MKVLIFSASALATLAAIVGLYLISPALAAITTTVSTITLVVVAVVIFLVATAKTP